MKNVAVTFSVPESIYEWPLTDKKEIRNIIEIYEAHPSIWQKKDLTNLSTSEIENNFSFSL